MRKWEKEEEELHTPNNSNRGLFEKFLNMFGFEAEEIEEDDESAAQGDYFKERDRGKLLSLTNSNKTVKMIVVEPVDFDEVQTFVDHLKNKRALILNLDETDKTTARRIIDFLSGAIYALEGTMQRISNTIFIFTPVNIEVSVPFRPEVKEKEKERPERPVNSGVPPSSSTFFRNDRER